MSNIALPSDPRFLGALHEARDVERRIVEQVFDPDFIAVAEAEAILQEEILATLSPEEYEQYEKTKDWGDIGNRPSDSLRLDTFRGMVEVFLAEKFRLATAVDISILSSGVRYVTDLRVGNAESPKKEQIQTVTVHPSGLLLSQSIRIEYSNSPLHVINQHDTPTFSLGDATDRLDTYVQLHTPLLDKPADELVALIE